MAGVVNLVINKHFSGFKANLVYGNSSYNDHQSYKGEVTAGTDFLGGRGHTEFAASYTMSPDTFYSWNRPWYNNVNRALYPCSLVNRQDRTHPVPYPRRRCLQYVLHQWRPDHRQPGRQRRRASAGALHSASGASWQRPASARCRGCQYIKGHPVRGTERAGRAVQYRHLVGQQLLMPVRPIVNTDVANAPLDAVPYHNYTLFSYTSFKLTDDITASVMLNYGWNAEKNQANNGRQSQQTIGIDNPFIPASIRQQMIAGGIPSLTLGSSAIENLQSIKDVTMFNLSKSIGQNYVQNYRQLVRGVFTLTGGLSPVRRGLVVERLCPEQLGARAAMGALQHHEPRTSAMPSMRWWCRRPVPIRWAAAMPLTEANGRGTG